MVTEPRRETGSRRARNGNGVAGRFRPLGSADHGRERATDPSPPGFATAPWGYRRAEVDAWATWVAGLVAHGQNETVRADSAEATLRATLERLERLERPARPNGPDDAGPLPRRAARGTESSGHTPEREPGPEKGPGPASGPATAGESTAGESTAGEPTAERSPPEQPAAEKSSSTPPGPATAQVTDARLQVVETTLREVMRLLHRLVGPEQPEHRAEHPPADS